MISIFMNYIPLWQFALSCFVALWGSYTWRSVYNFCKHYIMLLKAAQNFSGPPALPILGNALELAGNIDGVLDMFVKATEKYPTCRLWFGSKLVILITRPEDIEIILKYEGTSKKSFVYEFMNSLFVNSLLNGYGPEMRAHRRLIVPLLNGEYLADYMKSFNIQIRRAINDMAKNVGTGEFDIREEMKFCLADIASEALFGIPGVAQDLGDMEIPHAAETYDLESAAEIVFYRAVTPWLYPWFIFHLSKCGRTAKKTSKIVHEFINRLIEEKKELHERLARGDSTVKKPKPSLLDLWIENIVKTNAMSNQEIASDLTILYIGFYDSILGVFSAILLMLAMQPDIQEKVRQEVNTVIGAAEDISEEMAGKLNYTHMVIKETIRLFPIGPVLSREVTNDIKLGEYTIPKGCTVAMIVAATHKSDKYWDEPAKFIPERFSPGNSKQRHPYTYVPFSGGSRSCPGSKFGVSCLKVIVAQVLRHYRLTTNMKLENLRFSTRVSVRSRDGYRISMTKINHS